MHYKHGYLNMEKGFTYELLIILKTFLFYVYKLHTRTKTTILTLIDPKIENTFQKLKGEAWRA